MELGRGQRTLDGWLNRPPRPAAQTPQVTAPSASASTHNTSTSRRRRHDAYRQNGALAEVAEETRRVLPDILKKLPHIRADQSGAYLYENARRLRSLDCPRKTSSGRTRIKVFNEDSFNAAIRLRDSKGPASGRVAVLNLASHSSPGGGWLKGARAQEEALCYRSSLYLSLHKRYYPWRQRMGIYTPACVIIRSDMDSGHELLWPDVDAKDLPVVSVISIAALRKPPVDRIQIPTSDGMQEKRVFSRPSDRELTKTKMRLCLRMAAHQEHGLLVLGALGCGAFGNPPREVANCWLEVLKESEFQGGWWEDVWFAVYDKRNEGNFEIFEEILGDVEI
ncbi:hypothetical protein BGZ63DRAFT_352773 [Mariannaea sp. PMI_226]|nr:hypothetical protein BGZ63DRAFT_352773 [Mariannaea sp. PMI_226]